MVEVYTVTADGLKRRYMCGSAKVAAKNFLNYLRLYRKERPTRLQIMNESGKRFDVVASWYFGVLKESSFSGPEGEFYRLISAQETKTNKQKVIK